MAGETKAGTILDAVTVTGQGVVRLPKLPSMTLFFVEITGGTASVALEISDDEVLFIPVLVITETSAVQFAIPCSVVACDVTAIAGATVNVTYRTVVLENIPSETLLVYNSAGKVKSPIIKPEQQILEAAQVTRRKLAQVEVAASPTLIYTVPAATQTVIEAIMVVSTSVGDQLISLWHDGTADSNMILPPVIVYAGGLNVYDGAISMEPADTLYADCDAATAVTITVYGYEQGIPV